MHRGYIRSWRKSFESDVSKNVNVWYFWSWCLHRACYQEHDVILGYQTIKLYPGQLIFGRKKAAAELPLSEREIRTCMEFLKKSGNMTIKTTNKFSIISIVNWNIYQDPNIKSDHQSDQQATSKRPASDHIQERIKKDKEIKHTCSSVLSPDLQKSFSLFWSAYPKHQAKLNAEKSWLKLSPENGLVEKICECIERYKKTHDWIKDNGQFIPMPATWLNQRRWEDETTITVPYDPNIQKEIERMRAI
jgi:hypothetical protein